jgi:hypothetical protein
MIAQTKKRPGRIRLPGRQGPELRLRRDGSGGSGSITIES